MLETEIMGRIYSINCLHTQFSPTAQCLLLLLGLLCLLPLWCPVSGMELQAKVLSSLAASSQHLAFLSLAP